MSYLSLTLEVDLGGLSVPADGEDDGVEDVLELGAVLVLGAHADLAGGAWKIEQF